MADITFACPNCDEELEAPADYAGKTVECPGCAKEIQVPRAATVADAAEALDEDLEDEEVEAEPEAPADNVCPECGAEMEPDTILCLGCGYHVRLGRKIQTNFEEPPGADE